MFNRNKDTAAPFTVLHIDASARKSGSVSRDLSDRIVSGLMSGNKDAKLIRRDLADGVPFIDETFTAAINTPEDQRTAAQKDALGVSDQLVAELQAADAIVIGSPIYNFSVPAVFKAWIDQVARAGVTFSYTENGPVGLLENKKAYVALASGGTQVGSDIDFASGWIKHVMGFIGIHDVELVAADRTMMDDQSVARAEAAVENLAA
ncbi:NAD(P)H-dependent oxidoreductase [Pyruvatibacter sp. HU-CL02332]|uniref:FMN-dependent NADH-azoreductase n=1 Tax=Pyruvatibacter sp. HU-CL02332 TaxID=3127650 RepID=UPI003102B3E6